MSTGKLPRLALVNMILQELQSVKRELCCI